MSVCRAALVASQPWRVPPLQHRAVRRVATSSANSTCFVSCSVDPSSSSASTSSGGKKKEEHVDTRIHWGNSTEGWIGVDRDGGDDDSSSFDEASSWARSGGRKAGILDQAPDSHYRYMDVSPDAELEEIKAAYRRLSKQYHPDTTSLPLEIAAQKFMRLKDAYDTLSNEELRNLYNKRLENKVASTLDASVYGYESSWGVSQQGYDTRVNKRPEPVNVDSLGGRNMELSGQAQAALLFDLFVLFICICVILYVVFIKKAPT